MLALVIAVFVSTSAAAELGTVCEMSRRELPGWFCEIDVKKSGVVRSEQFMAYQMKQFDRLDRNADGVLTLNEYLQLAEGPFSEGRGLPAADTIRDLIRRGFRSVDIDGDGKVSRSEFEAGARRMFEAFDRNRDGRLTPDDWPPPSPMSRAPKPLPNPDVNGDGFVDREEFVNFETAPLWELDVNRDGRLDLEEWLRAAANWHEHTQHPAYLRRRERLTERFREIDTNNDGYISLAETRAMAIAQFERMDLNHDGKLTPEEWRRAYAPWDRPPLH
jgi:Ca2+-binding EF-hand superfamily protein